MAETVREKILQALQAAYEAVEEGRPSVDPYEFQYDFVRRVELGDSHRGKGLVLGIFDGEETKAVLTNQRVALMTVVLEARGIVPEGVSDSTQGNRILGGLLRTLYENNQLGGLCVQINDVSSDVDADALEDRYVSVTVVCQVQYRHGTKNPRTIA